jgi:[lysine-biosynthesis-protein LysW]--L-2-aminoadipate ligase
MAVLVVGNAQAEANVLLASAWLDLGIGAEVVAPAEARARARPRDVLIGRLDVLRSLDGVEPGLLELFLLERRGATVLNRASMLLAAHDKLRTACLLRRAGLPHPRTEHLRPGGTPALAPPLVVKPRFGSWGADVFRCDSEAELRRCLAAVEAKPWFRRHGALLQELVPPVGRDLRVLVAGGRVVGAIERTAAAGDWRTNVSLGGSRRSTAPPARARALAVAAATAIRADLVGVDLLPYAGAFVVIELNGAVDFDIGYGLPGHNVYADAAYALGLDYQPAAAAG